ncbi:MAG: hypothetical protein K2X77_18330 [Candidatus Obscuribacterales bacterium]|nr:hypothetical protein [Candidatus Obscuribacterales bacterium]
MKIEAGKMPALPGSNRDRTGIEANSKEKRSYNADAWRRPYIANIDRDQDRRF